MGRIVNVTDSVYVTSAVGLTYSVLIGSNVENDIVLVKISTGETSALGAAPAGWTQLGTQGASQGCRSAWYYRVAPAGGISSPVSFTVPNGHTIGTCVVIRGANTTPTLKWQRYDWGNSTNIASAASTSVTASSEAANAMITPPDNALLLYSFTSDGGPYLRASQNELMALSFVDGQSSGVSHAIGYRQHSTGTLPVVNFYASLATEGGNMWVISIADDGTGILDRQWLSGGDEFFYAGDYGEALFPFGTTTNAATTIDDAQASPPATPTLGGYDLSSTAAAYQSAAASVVNSSNGTGTRLRTTLASTPTVWQGLVQTLNANKNMEGKIFAMHYIATINSTTPLGSDGMAIAFADADGDWTAYRLATEVGLLADSERVCFISLGYGAELGNGVVGTMDWSDIDKIGYLIQRTGNDATIIDLTIKNLMLLGTATITGGYADLPATFQWSVTPASSWAVYDIQRLQGAAQSMVNWPLQIGDGTAKTYFKASESSYTTPAEYSVASATSQQDWNVPAGRAGITLYAKASDTMDFSAALLSNSVLQPFGFHASSATSSTATFDFQGCVFVGWDVTWKTGVECEGATFSNCDTVKFKGASPTNVTIKNCHADVGATDAACSFDANGATLTTSTIDVTGSNAGYHAAFGASVTSFEINGTTLSGTPGVTKFYSELASGTLTITTDGTGTALADTDVTFVGGSTAVAVIAAPELYQSVAITGLANTYRLQIFDIEYVLTVSGITVTPTAGATYTHNGITWTVRSATIVAGAGTITVYGTGTPSASGTLTKTGGTGDASVTFSAYAVDGTELYIGVPGATSYTWTDTVAAAAPRVIRVRVMEDGPGTSDAIEMIDAIVGMCGITDGTESVGYLVAAVADDVYNDRGVDGSAITGITIDDTTLRLEISSGTITNYNGTDVLVVDGRDLYAYETYWLGTTAGMRDEARFIEAIDAVNFRCSNFKLKGTSGYPIMINNCYMVDTATGIFASLVDYSGDPISNAPDHMAAIVVSTSDAVISGTAAEIIAAIPTASANATAVAAAATASPFAVDVKKMNGATVAGTGIAGDLWRGA